MRFAFTGLMLLGLWACSPTNAPAAPTNPSPGSPPRPTLVPIPAATSEQTRLDATHPLHLVPLTGVEIGRFERFELEVKTDIIPENPFDPDELDIRIQFTSPSGKSAEVGAFWYQGFDSVGRNALGQPGWRARFTPTDDGEWTAVAIIEGSDLHSDPLPFRVLPADKPGFVRVNPENPRYFAFDRGDFFFPIGLNMAWWSGAGDPLSDYRRWMDLFAANGGNTIRVWMADWSFGLEWNDTPLGDYTRRLKRAWYLDQIFKMAEERDIYIDLVLLNCADFNNWQTDGWNHNPYNAKLGGPLEDPQEYVTDPTARALLQRRLNYIVNRWGYSTHLLAWEWWNEVNLAPFTDETLIPWLEEMTAYLRARDVNQHLVTNSYAIRDLSPIWSLPELDIIQKHEYSHQINSPVRDLAERAAADFERLAASAPPKPILLGEFGYGNEGLSEDIDKSGIHLHNGLWATTFAGYAGSGMYWFWDVYVEAYTSWHHFRGLKRFLEGMDLSGYQPFSPLEIRGPGGEAGQAAGLSLRGEDILIWLRSDGYTVQAVEAAWQQAGSPRYYPYTPPLVEGEMLMLWNVEDGDYTVHWYDPQSAKWTDTVVVEAEDGTLSIPIPAFRRDLAAQIVQNG